MSLLKSKPAPTPVLDEQMVTDLRNRIDSFIDDKVSRLRLETPGVPAAVLRNILTHRSGDCLCRAFLNIAAADAVDAEIAARSAQ